MTFLDFARQQISNQNYDEVVHEINCRLITGESPVELGVALSEIFEEVPPDSDVAEWLYILLETLSGNPREI